MRTLATPGIINCIAGTQTPFPIPKGKVHDSCRTNTARMLALTVPYDAALGFRGPGTAVAAGNHLTARQSLRGQMHKGAAREHLLEAASEPEKGSTALYMWN
jgi:hypothetical protein